MTQNASKSPSPWDGVPVFYLLPWQLVRNHWSKSFSSLPKQSTLQSV